jgi:hypothetical protein
LLVKIWPAKPKWDVEVVKVKGEEGEGGLRLPGR